VSGSIVLRGPAVVGRTIRPDVVIAIADGRIQSVLDASDSNADARRAERVADGLVIAPGWVDGHIHGAAGADVTHGVEAIRHVAEALARRGVTSWLPSAVAAPLERLSRFSQDVAEAAEWHDAPVAAILGGHLEGPALDPAHRGAHDPNVIVDPSVVAAAFRRSPDDWTAVRIVTLAPERPGGLDLVRLLAERGIVASVGHTGATHDEARAAYDAGATSTTHILNAMTGLQHRSPGVALAALLDPRPAVELIADGVHVDPALFALVRALAGSRLVLVSDAVAAAATGGGPAAAAAARVAVRDGRATLADGTLAGSMLSLAESAVRFRAAGASLVETVLAGSTRPARLAGARGKGRIARGADADLVALRDDATVTRVWRAGTELSR
jgi:N-acetylglucosamine-6-phosphate deacetylase